MTDEEPEGSLILDREYYPGKTPRLDLYVLEGCQGISLTFQGSAARKLSNLQVGDYYIERQNHA